MSKTKYPRALALDAARDLAAALRPWCLPERLIVAGSLRRRKAEVSDVEIVYVPRIVDVEDDGDLFRPPARVNQAEGGVIGLVAAGVIRPRENVLGRTTWGEANKLAVHVASGVPVDLFGTSEAAFWNYLVCRTGPAEFNLRIAATARDRGWMWHPTGTGFEHLATGERHVVRSERDVFDFLGWPYAEPWERT